MKSSTWEGGPIAIVGAGGMLGQELSQVLTARAGGSRDVIAWHSSDLDVRDRRAVFVAIEEIEPTVVLNASGYTDVDGCESHLDEAIAVNAHGPRHLAEACRAIGAKLVHFSTDFVFDGRSRKPYRPTDPTNPISAYGRSKFEGERGVDESGCEFLIIRTSWLFGAFGRNFVEAIVSRAASGLPLKVVNDQIGRPTYAADLAAATLRLLDGRAGGVQHFANTGSCTWFAFAEAIVKAAGMRAPIEPITSDQLGRPAKRPSYSVLDTSEYTRITGHQPDAWDAALARYFSERACTRSGVGAFQGAAAV